MSDLENKDIKRQQNKEQQILQIFTMCKKLASLYDNDEEVIADVAKLANLHKDDMFKDGNIQAVINTIQEVLSEPNLIIKNHRAKKQKDYIVAKRNLSFENKSMGDVGVARDKGTNYVFHANKKDSHRFDRIKRKAIKMGLVEYSQSIVGASNPHTSRPAELNASNKTLLGASAHLSTAEPIISQKELESQERRNEVIHATRVDESDLKRLEKVSKAREKESSALSKLSSDKVANELETQLGLPSETISETNSTIKELESQVQELTQITIDTADIAPKASAMLANAYDKCGENALANTLINTISADEKVMQSVQREFENLIQQESEQSTQSVDEVTQTQQELDEAQILQQGDDKAQVILGDEVNVGPKGPRQ